MLVCAQVHRSKLLGCNAGCQEVSRCRTRSESEDSIAGRRGNMHPGFETQGRHHQKSQTGVPVVPRIGPMSSKKIKKISLTVQRLAVKFRNFDRHQDVGKVALKDMWFELPLQVLELSRHLIPHISVKP